MRSQGFGDPREIDIALVNAQQARRLLDRIVGYKISPILNRRIQRGRKTFYLLAVSNLWPLNWWLTVKKKLMLLYPLNTGI